MLLTGEFLEQVRRHLVVLGGILVPVGAILVTPHLEHEPAHTAPEAVSCLQCLWTSGSYLVRLVRLCCFNFWFCSEGVLGCASWMYAASLWVTPGPHHQRHV